MFRKSCEKGKDREILGFDLLGDELVTVWRCKKHDSIVITKTGSDEVLGCSRKGARKK